MWGHGFPFGLGCIGGVLAVDGTTVSGVAAEGEKRYIHRISVRSGRESRLMDIGVLSDAHRSVF